MAKAQTEATGMTRRQVLMEALRASIRNAIGNRNVAQCTPSDLAAWIAQDDFEVMRIYAAFGYADASVEEVRGLMEEATNGEA